MCVCVKEREREREREDERGREGRVAATDRTWSLLNSSDASEKHGKKIRERERERRKRRRREGKRVSRVIEKRKTGEREKLSE